LHLKWPPIAEFFVKSDEKQEDDNIYTSLQLTVAVKIATNSAACVKVWLQYKKNIL